MNNDPLNDSPNSIGIRIKFSIVWKLNIKLFLRLLGLLLVLDIFLCLGSAVGLIVRTEQTAAAAAQILNQTGLPSPETANYLALTGCGISLQTEETYRIR